MQTVTSTHPHSLDLASVRAGLRAGAVVVDGRPAEVFDAGHAAGAVNIPPGGEDVGALAVSAWRTQASSTDWPRKVATGAVLLVDVRDDWEWQEGHVPGSLHLPLESLREAAHLLPAVPIVTVCSGTRRAAAAASALRGLGLRNIWRVADGGVPDLLARPLGLDLLGAT